jgi:hypothetical protein
LQSHGICTRTVRRAIRRVEAAQGEEQTASEAFEHMLEHLIMGKQNQIDFLLRARRIS